LAKLDHLGWVVEQSYSFGGHLVGIRTTSEAFGAWLEETLGEYRVKDEAPVHYSVVVEEGPARKGERRYHIMYSGTVMLARTRDVSMLGRRLLSELELSLLDERDDLIFLEAAPVAANGVNVLVPVILVSYVTSLGRLLQRVGLSLPAHAFVAVDPARGTIVPTPPVLVDVDEAVRGLAAVFPPNGEAESYLVIDRPWPIDVVCSIGQGEPGIVEPVSRATALHRLTNRVVNLKKLQGTALHGLERLVSAARCRQVMTAGPRNVVDAIVAETRALSGA
jgi:hypothetical protein